MAYVELTPRARADSSVITIAIPGSKSFTNRSLVLASLASGTSTLLGASPSDDTSVLIRALSSLGITIGWAGNALLVEGRHGALGPAKGVVDVGPAGTSFRFLTAAIAQASGTEVILTGSQRLQERPIAPLVAALQQLGANITYLKREHYPPLEIKGCDLHGDTVRIAGNVSSQFLTALLLIGAKLPNGIAINVDGELVSKSYLEMTFATLAQFGVHVENDDWRTLRIAPGASLRGTTYNVEGDGSGATYFWGLAALANIPVRVHSFPSDSRQGDLHFPLLLQQMGCQVSRGTDWIEVGPSTLPHHELRPITANLENLPDAAQTLAVIAACASGTSTLTGLRTLRVKETDRLAALVTELGHVGISAQADDDSITITGGTPHALAEIATYEDHRMAMAFALLGARVKHLRIQHPSVVSKSFPSFWDLLSKTEVIEVRFP